MQGKSILHNPHFLIDIGYRDLSASQFIDQGACRRVYCFHLSFSSSLMKSWETIARRLLQFRNADSNNYELSPVANEDDRRFRAARPTSPSSSPTRSIAFACVHLITLRRCLLFFVSVFSLLSIGVLWSGIPPSYNNIREYEKKLPQHNKKLPSPEGENGMYLRFPEHLWGHGLNNVLQEQ